MKGEDEKWAASEMLKALTRNYATRANFFEFLRLVVDFRKVWQRTLRQAEGFTPAEVEALRERFNGAAIYLSPPAHVSAAAAAAAADT